MSPDSASPKWCRYGITYARVDEERVITGVLATGTSAPPRRAQRRLRLEPGRRIRAAAITGAIAKARRLGPGVVKDLERTKQAALSRMKTDPELQKAVADHLRLDFDETLNQSHDFRQLVYQVRGHAESLLREQVPDVPVEEAAEQRPALGAIYFANEMLLIKMDALRFLKEVNLAFGAQTRFQMHPFILKYVRIYRWQADQKDLTLRLEGTCYASSRYNNEAIGVIIQSLLDNMVKYAPAGSNASITFDEQEGHVDVAFRSLGPHIDEDEFDRIFLPGYRGRAASPLEQTGLGVGLASAKEISDALGLDLKVSQHAAEDVKYAGRYETTFSLRLARVA